jgi:hypothetical protein
VWGTGWIGSWLAWKHYDSGDLPTRPEIGRFCKVSRLYVAAISSSLEKYIFLKELGSVEFE